MRKKSGKDLSEVFGCGPHLLPRLVEELYTAAVELLERSVMGEEHRVVHLPLIRRWTEARHGLHETHSLPSSRAFERQGPSF